MTRFKYRRPASIKEALSLLTEHGPKAMLLGGGTDLLVQIRAQQKNPAYLIDVKGIPELTFIRRNGNKIVIGSLTTIAEIFKSELIRKNLTMLADACGQLGSTQTRNKATIGGNICNASPSAETACPLLALDAAVETVGPNGERTLDINDFFIGPGKSVLGFDEIVTKIIIPLPENANASCYQKIGRRKAMDIAIANAAVAIKRRGNIFLDARVALGSVAPTPMRSRTSESILKGATWSPELIDEAAEKAFTACQPVSDVRASAWYRCKMVRVIVKRTLQTAWDNAVNQ